MFSANNRTSVNGLSLLIDLLSQRGADFEPILMTSERFDSIGGYPVINSKDRGFFFKIKQKAKRRDNRFSKDNTETERLGSDSITNRDQIFNKGKKRILYIVPHFIVCFIRIIQDLIYADGILDKVKPDWIIVSDDRVGGVQLALLKKAKGRGIPIIMVSVAIQTLYKKDGFGPLLFDESRFVTNKLFDVNRFQSRKQILRIGEDERVFFPSYYYFALRCFNMAPEHPWVSGANASDCVYTYSEEVRESILSEEPGKKVIVSGLVEDDYILRNIKDSASIKLNLLEKYNLSCDDKVVLLSMPQLAEHNLVSWDIHIHNMDVLTKLLSREYGKLFVSLHPKSRKQDYEYLKKYNVTIIDEKLRDVMVAADYFFCLSNSSTTHYAGILHIPGYDLDMDCFLDYLNEESDINALGRERDISSDTFSSKSVVDYIFDELNENIK